MEKIQKSKKKMISKKVNTKRKAAKKQGKTPIKKKEDVKVKTGITFDQVVSKGCGLDVHKKTVVASIAGDGIKPETKTFKTFTPELEKLCAWLKNKGITHIRELRDLTRYRKKVVQQIAAEKNRLQKVLEDGNVKLSSVVSDMSGVSATKIIDAIIEGEKDPQKLYSLCHAKIQATEEEITAAVNNKLTEHHKFMLQLIKSSIKDKEKIIEQLNTQIDKLIEKQQLTLDMELLQTIPGVAKYSAESIIAEIGNDMEQFPSEKHLSAWAGMAPGNNETAGKKKTSKTTHGDKYLRSCLVECGWGASRTKDTYLGSKYNSLVPRRGKKRALIAIGHKILIASYHILKNKVEYKELGADYLESRRKSKTADRYMKKLKEMGYEIEIKKAA